LKIYELEFHLLAQKEWQKLDSSVREQFKKQISKRLLQPHIQSARLSAELSNFYKIKLKALGYRLVYEVLDHRLVIVVIAVGRRENNSVYMTARTRVVQ
jgi:mRNA interferase RelE/StbE